MAHRGSADKALITRGSLTREVELRLFMIKVVGRFAFAERQAPATHVRWRLNFK